MGYETNFVGELRLNKPLENKIKDTVFEPTEEEYRRLPKDLQDSRCCWKYYEEGAVIFAEDGEAYDYVVWLRYIIDNFLDPNGYVLNGDVEWYGEDPDDRGRIIVVNNSIKVYLAKITWVKLDE